MTRRLRLIEVVETLAPDRRDGDGSAAGGRRCFRRSAENPKDDPGFRVPRRRLGPHRPRTCSRSNGSTASTLTDCARPCAPQRFDLQGARPRTSSSPSCATRCATASSTPTCIRETCSSTPDGNASSRSISASWAGSARRSGASSPKSCYGFITRNYRRVAEVHFEAGYVPRIHNGRRLRPGDPRHRRADPRPAAPTKSRWRRCWPCCSRSPSCSTCRPAPELVLLQKTMVVVEGVARALDPQLDMWTTVRAGRAATGSRRDVGPLGRLEDARERRRALVSLARQCPASPARARALVARDRRHGRATACAVDEGASSDRPGRSSRHAAGRALALWVIAAAGLGGSAATALSIRAVMAVLSLIARRMAHAASLSTIGKLRREAEAEQCEAGAMRADSMEQVRVRCKGPAYKGRTRLHVASAARREVLDAIYIYGVRSALFWGAGAAGWAGKRILLIIGGGIAAYKSLDLIRRLRERGAWCAAVMTAARAAVRHAAVGRRADRRPRASPICSTAHDEHDVGHIRLSREADLVVVAPATADLMAKLANGLANDLALRRAARHRQEGTAGAGHETQDVGATRPRAATARQLAKGRRPSRRPQHRRDGRERRGGRRAHGGAAGDRCAPVEALLGAAPRRRSPGVR